MLARALSLVPVGRRRMGSAASGVVQPFLKPQPFLNRALAVPRPCLSRFLSVPQMACFLTVTQLFLEDCPGCTRAPSTEASLPRRSTLPGSRQSRGGGTLVLEVTCTPRLHPTTGCFFREYINRSEANLASNTKNRMPV